MNQEEVYTKQRILEAGKKEFLSHGFRGASLRQIVKNAGVTTGAFYGYYKSKEELFYALTKEAATTILDTFNQAQKDFASLPAEEQPEQVGKISGKCMDFWVEYMYEHFDAFLLILTAADGTEYENFIHTLVETEVYYTHRFMNVLREMGQEVKEIDLQLEHILVSGMFSGFFEIIIHHMPKDRAIKYVEELRAFYIAGWERIMGL